MKEHKIGNLSYSHPSVHLKVEDVSAEDVVIKNIFHTGPVQHDGFDIEIPLTRAGQIEQSFERTKEFIENVKDKVEEKKIARELPFVEDKSSDCNFEASK